MSKHCPCGKKKSGLYIQCFNEDCEVGWWHTVCCGFNKDVTRKQLDGLGYWSCPCCVMKAIQAPGYNLGCSSCNSLISKMDGQLDELKGEIADLKSLKEDLADLNKEQTKQNQTWSDIAGVIPKDKDSFASTLAKKVVDHSARVISERESRENVIIFNANESTSDDVLERKQHDENIFDEVCKFVCNKTISVGKVIRIGKKHNSNNIVEDENDALKPRPLKVCFSNSFDKRIFLSSLSKLKDAPDDLKKVSI